MFIFFGLSNQVYNIIERARVAIATHVSVPVPYLMFRNSKFLQQLLGILQVESAQISVGSRHRLLLWSAALLCIIFLKWDDPE